MPLLLSLETSTTVCSVALHNDGNLVASAQLHTPHSHASKLAVLVEQVMKVAGVHQGNIAAVAVSSGPGSYTGLRIGTSTAKGLCYALSVPLIAVGTLEVMAAGMHANNVTTAWLCPMIDARRMEVYCQLFDRGIARGPVEAKVIDDHSFAAELEQHPIIFFGDGAEKCRTVITHPNAMFVPGYFPSAVQLGAIAWKRFAEKNFVDLVHFEPFYLKEFMIKKPATVNPAVPNNFA